MVRVLEMEGSVEVAGGWSERNEELMLPELQFKKMKELWGWVATGCPTL